VARQLILDTGVLIQVERGKLDLHQVIGDDEPAIAAITATEILVGVESSTAELRDVRALHTEALLAVLEVEPYNVTVARMHALLIAWTRRTGHARGPFDLIIAATAGATGRTLITTDKAAGFDELPGVTAEVVSLN
jgi:tRNA(fMet)-specific endonuclease VapC